MPFRHFSAIFLFLYVPHKSKRACVPAFKFSSFPFIIPHKFNDNRKISLIDNKFIVWTVNKILTSKHYVFTDTNTYIKTKHVVRKMENMKYDLRQNEKEKWKFDLLRGIFFSLASFSSIKIDKNMNENREKKKKKTEQH